MFYDIYLYTLCYYICCLLGACMRCTRLCPLNPGVTLGPPTVVLVQQTSDNPVDVPESLDKFDIFFYLSRNVSPVLQTLQNIGDIGMRKRLHKLTFI
jgi:hypothetical protein